MVIRLNRERGCVEFEDRELVDRLTAAGAGEYPEGVFDLYACSEIMKALRGEGRHFAAARTGGGRW